MAIGTYKWELQAKHAHAQLSSQLVIPQEPEASPSCSPCKITHNKGFAPERQVLQVALVIHMQATPLNHVNTSSRCETLKSNWHAL